MLNKFTRKEKISLLNAIKNGIISIRDIGTPKVYVFSPISGKEGYYTMNGDEYSPVEYEDFCLIVDQKNQRLKACNGMFPIIKEDLVITIVYKPGKTIL
jgi:hypothetical protein